MEAEKSTKHTGIHTFPMTRFNKQGDLIALDRRGTQQQRLESLNTGYINSSKKGTSWNHLSSGQRPTDKSTMQDKNQRIDLN